MFRLRPTKDWLLALLAILAAFAGCESPSRKPAQPVILISVAASTKEAVAELAAAFEKKSGARVRINAGPSSALANQILADAPADLFLSANEYWADKLAKPGHLAESKPLLTSRLVLIVPKGNPAGVKEPADLLKAEVQRVALAGESVPAGMYGQEVLWHFKVYDQLVEANKIARGQDVRSTLSYVERGEAEAGIVYSTDVLTSGQVEMVYEFDPRTHGRIVYVLVLLRHADDNAAAKDFYRFLASPDAEATWQQFGFERIPSDL